MEIEKASFTGLKPVKGSSDKLFKIFENTQKAVKNGTIDCSYGLFQKSVNGDIAIFATGQEDVSLLEKKLKKVKLTKQQSEALKKKARKTKVYDIVEILLKSLNQSQKKPLDADKILQAMERENFNFSSFE